MSRSGHVLVLVVLVALAGCTGLSGFGDDATPEPTPTDVNPTTPAPTPTPTATPTPTPTPEPTSTSTPTPDYPPGAVASGVENPEGVELITYANNKSVTLLKGTVTVYDRNGAEQLSFGFDGNDTHAIDDLKPGVEYTLVVSEIGWHEMPPVETTFDPGQTDTVEVFTLPDFQQADKFEWKWRFIQGAYVNDTTFEFENREDFVERERQLLGGGVYDTGDWFATWNELTLINDPDGNETAALSIDGDIYTRDFHKNWRKINRTALNPTYQPSFAPVRDGIFNIDNITLEYVDTRGLNDSTVPEALRVRSLPEQNKGERVHVFNIGLWGYSERAGGPYAFDVKSEARIYVDVDTGHILRWEARERVSIGVGYYDYYTGMNPSIHVIDFYNHGDEDIDIDPDDYPPTSDD